MKNKINLFKLRSKYQNQINKITNLVNDKFDTHHVLKNVLMKANINFGFPIIKQI